MMWLRRALLRWALVAAPSHVVWAAERPASVAFG